jgi:hypothetical protein
MGNESRVWTLESIERQPVRFFAPQKPGDFFFLAASFSFADGDGKIAGAKGFFRAS